MRCESAIVIEVAAWATSIGLVVWGTVLERQAYDCTSHATRSKNIVKWGIPLLGVLFLSTCGVAIHIMVCGCKCIGCVVEKTVGPDCRAAIRLTLGATIPIVCIFVAKYVALPHCATLEQEDRRALVAVAGINIVLFVAAIIAHIRTDSRMGGDALLEDT
jgi:uncharacterized membrane protein YidH (DUF202 family)